MDNTPEVTKLNSPPKEKSVLDMSKLLSALEGRTIKEPQQSMLKKSPVGGQKPKNLIKFIPKSTIPLKTLKGPNGNIIVHGPHNKIVSLQLKPTSSTISLLPIKIPKDAKPTKVPALALIGSHAKCNSKNVIITKAMLPKPIISNNLSKIKDAITSNMTASTSSNNKILSSKGKDPNADGNVTNTSSNANNSLLAPKTKNNLNNSTGNTPNSVSCAVVSTTAEKYDSPATINSIGSLPSAKGKDAIVNNPIVSLPSTNSKSILLPAKLKDISFSSAINTPGISSTSSEIKELVVTDNPFKQINYSNSELHSKTMKDLSTSKIISTQAVTSLPGKIKDIFLNTQQSITPITTTATVSTSALEIKPITLTNSPKALTPAQAATVPLIPSLQIAPFCFPKNVSAKSSNPETNPFITVEKKNIKQKYSVTLKKDLIQTVGNSSLINKSNSKSDAKIQNIPHITKVLTRNVSEKNDLKTLANNEMLNESVNNDSNIRVRSIESLTQCNTRPKLKQQSLLKNKAIEKLKRSPRTKGRSKSLTSVIGKNGLKGKKTGRRLSTCSDSDIKKKRPKLSLSECLIQAVRDNTPPKADISLLCHEKMEVSPANSSIQNSHESLLSNVSSSVGMELSNNIIKYEGNIIEPEIILPDNEQPAEDIIHPLKLKPIEIISLLNWKDGIGLSTNCKINFQINEFGLIEIADDTFTKHQVDIGYEKPIYEREYKSQNTSDYSDPLYYCKGCNCQGAAVDFLAPDFCSHECIQRYNYRSLNGLNLKPATKKYMNRRRDMDKVKPIAESIPKKSFNWTYYLNARKEEPAPIDLFPNPFPCGPNLFKTGMKLEAIDPEHSNLFCVCTIVEKKGYRLKLHFDGFLKKYDYWVNADSMDIFPPGWCSKTNRILQPPKGMNQITFNWPMYLNKTRSASAARNLFTHLNSSCTTNPFEFGMKLEADDLRNTRKVCVASVADVLDNRILVHFDGWDESYDYWIDINSPYIHPVNWHQKNGFSIVPPPDWEEIFDWRMYLTLTRGIPATEELFSTRDPIAFHVGMKLEVVDKKNPSLIRPATVIMADEYEIKVLFDGWPEKYAFWVVDDSPDIHPVGWCEATGHELEVPPGFENLRIKMHCPFPGCRGIGNAKRPETDFHTTVDACPYEISNWYMEIDRSTRLEIEETQSIPPPTADEKINLPKRNFEENDPPAKVPKLEKTSLDNGEDIKKRIDTRLNISHQLLCDYGPRLQFIHNLWTKNSECLTKNLTEPILKNPLKWTVEEVTDYIKRILKNHMVSEEFRKQEIDGTALLSMRQNDLTELMNMKLGPAIKVYNQIVQLREEVVTSFS